MQNILNNNLNEVIKFDNETPSTCLDILATLRKSIKATNPNHHIIKSCEALIKTTIKQNSSQFKQIKTMIEQIQHNIYNSESTMTMMHKGASNDWMIGDRRLKLMSRKV